MHHKLPDHKASDLSLLSLLFPSSFSLTLADLSLQVLGLKACTTVPGSEQ